MWLLLLLLSRGSAFYLPKKSTCSWDRTASRLVSYRLALSTCRWWAAICQWPTCTFCPEVLFFAVNQPFFLQP